jgi:hypothetical protein
LGTKAKVNAKAMQIAKNALRVSEVFFSSMVSIEYCAGGPLGWLIGCRLVLPIYFEHFKF